MPGSSPVSRGREGVFWDSGDVYAKLMMNAMDAGGLMDIVEPASEQNLDRRLSVLAGGWRDA